MDDTIGLEEALVRGSENRLTLDSKDITKPHVILVS